MDRKLLADLVMVGSCWIVDFYYSFMTGVQLYLPYVNKIIPDYSMIYAGQFYDVDQNKDPNNINDALWCQSANSGLILECGIILMVLKYL